MHKVMLEHIPRTCLTFSQDYTKATSMRRYVLFYFEPLDERWTGDNLRKLRSCVSLNKANHPTYPEWLIHRLRRWLQKGTPHLFGSTPHFPITRFILIDYRLSHHSRNQMECNTVERGAVVARRYASSYNTDRKPHVYDRKYVNGTESREPWLNCWAPATCSMHYEEQRRNECLCCTIA